jgi:hypothetical protein
MFVVIVVEVNRGKGKNVEYSEWDQAYQDWS